MIFNPNIRRICSTTFKISSESGSVSDDRNASGGSQTSQDSQFLEAATATTTATKCLPANQASGLATAAGAAVLGPESALHNNNSNIQDR